MTYESKLTPHGHRSMGRKDVLRDLDVEARVAADQARLRAERAHWLEVERAKYRLPRAGRDIYDMPA